MTPSTADGFRSGRFVALGHDFALAAEDPVLGAHLASLFRPFACAGEPASLYRIAGRPEHGGPYLIELDGGQLLATADLPLLLQYVPWHVNQEVIMRTQTHVLVHASAAARDGRAILLPAAMDAGKTTLVAGLVLAGFSYLTDEAAALHLDNGLIDPYPRTLTIERSGWHLFPGLEPAAAEALPFRQERWHVDPHDVRAGSPGVRSRVSFIVAPEYRAGAATELLPISRAEMLEHLAAHAFNLTGLGTSAFHVLAGVVRSSYCGRLRVGDLAEAVELLGKLFAGTIGSGHAE